MPRTRSLLLPVLYLFGAQVECLRQPIGPGQVNFGLRIFQSETEYKIPCIDEFCLRNAGEAAIILNEPQIDPSS
jgi:hypothetical protein